MTGEYFVFPIWNSILNVFIFFFSLHLDKMRSLGIGGNEEIEILWGPHLPWRTPGCPKCLHYLQSSYMRMWSESWIKKVLVTCLFVFLQKCSIWSEFSLRLQDKILNLQVFCQKKISSHAPIVFVHWKCVHSNSNQLQSRCPFIYALLK